MNPGETMQPSTVTSPDYKPQRIRIVLADDHPIVRDGLRKLLTLEEDIEVVGEASDGREVVQVV
jgi:CheY-like chemotaxis protein